MNESSAHAELTAVLSDAPEATDHEAVRKYIHRLVEVGLAVMLVWPGSKTPADMRSPQRKHADDEAAQEEARAAGRRDWQKVKSPAGLALATTNVDTLDGYLKRYIKTLVRRYPGGGVPVNLAVEVGSSGLVVVDCDTAGQVSAFLGDAEADPSTAPTVRSPGQLGPDGTMVHSDGGHYWFTVPDGVGLPNCPGAMTLGAGGDAYSVLWDRRYVLIPPSVRAEGAYTATGKVCELPPWLADRIAAHTAARVERAAHRAEHITGGSDKVAQWGASVTWTGILEGTDWTNTGKVDGCGCDVWTAPGPHASPKSATAHELGCSLKDSDDPCLHIWTDHDIEPFGAMVAQWGAHLTRLRAVAAIHYDNDMGVAMADLSDAYDDLAVDLPADFGKSDTGGQAIDASGDGETGNTSGARSLRVTWAASIEPEPVDWLWVDISATNTGLAAGPNPYTATDIACVATRCDWSPPEVETDGRIPCGMVTIAAGREGSGKSSFGIWLTAHITRGTLPGSYYGTPRKVFYLATEDSWKHTLVPRLMAAGADLSLVARIEVITHEVASVTLSLPDDIGLLNAAITEHDVALVVIDPLMSTLNGKLSANDSREVRTALEPLAAMADKTRAAVVAIAHFNKATGLDSLSRITGSGAFKDVARAGMVFGNDGEDRVFTQPKNSVGRSDLPSLKYTIQQEIIETPNGRMATGKFVFTGLAERTVDEAMADERRGGRQGRRSEVAEFLIDYISEHADEHTGEVDAAEVIAAGKGKGFTENQIGHARRRCRDPKIGTRSEGFGKDKRHLWKLTGADWCTPPQG
ncbi:hypothetical protein CRI77_22470 [Mycolicibacterium duvalii]|uniref:Uncharacterized protein n=1 Tax=Mycolicibacterium duvalii TaxID=39688 RepID=A0A7I7JVG6_9MYCO|nr:AAA family ATPase [Mycolicibacterium duvalii]MCV7368540.1 AAA family ATPase [Mycolicibacterium duvalii]PEG36746.1 hypothetical protein CRI77_22470 [Mycolicibacterium duvalii]BBX15234.1 hypothetical protein MDUV_00940 [Mycolicibacterium duvalii]